MTTHYTPVAKALHWLIALLLFGLLFGGRNDWLADLAGFASGFGLSFLVVPGGWSRLREVLRRRVGFQVK